LFLIGQSDVREQRHLASEKMKIASWVNSILIGPLDGALLHEISRKVINSDWPGENFASKKFSKKPCAN